MKKILIVDGNSILNRAFYGIRPLTTKDGLFTQAVYGFVNILSQKSEQVCPDYAVCAFDLRTPTFRHKAYDGYKATRHGMPQELAVQLPYAKKCAEALGFRVATLEGYEADDIIGTVSNFANLNEDLHAYVLTGDRDSLQLIGDNVTVLLATNKETVNFDEARFIEEYGIKPTQFVDVKALMGDSSDNIPGVAGIGEKTALRLISDYSSLDGLYADIENKDIAKGTKQKLIDGKDSAYGSQFLATIVRDAPTGFTLDEIKYGGFDKPVLKELFTTLEFTGFIKRFGLDEISDGASRDGSEVCPSVTEYEKADLSLLADTDKNALCAVALADGGLYVSVNERDLFFGSEDISSFGAFLSDTERHFCTFDSKLLYKTLKTHGFTLSADCFDVKLAAYVLDSSNGTAQNEILLARLCTAYLGKSIKDGDAGVRETLELTQILREKLKEDGTEDIYEKAELPLARVLADMEYEGFRVDRTGLMRFGELLSKREEELAEAIYECAGDKFNINSPKQLGEVLFDKLGLPVLKKNKTGYSTGAEVLEKLAPYHPVIALILEYRQISKFKSTYAEGLLNVADENGTVHTTFNQTVTATGRLSSTEPNLQNIPIKSELGREFRRFFIPHKEGYTLIDADYSQIELRLLAHVSGDEKMREAFINGADIHTATASEVFGVDTEDVNPAMRKRAKAVNFGIIYGIGAYSLSQDIGVSRKEADEYIKSYFEKYPKIKTYIDNTVKEAHENGFVKTEFGRKRYIPEISSSKAALRSFGERVAMNSPIQGTAADIIKLAMVNIDRALKESGLDAKIILQVHDELILCAKKEDADKAKALLRSGMENVVSLSVPLTVELNTADTWYDCK